MKELILNWKRKKIEWKKGSFEVYENKRRNLVHKWKKKKEIKERINVWVFMRRMRLRPLLKKNEKMKLEYEKEKKE